MVGISCDAAQSKTVPPGFGQDDFTNIVSYARRYYLDPGSVDISRSYVGAAEAALKSLPYPLVLMSKSFYEKRSEIQDADRIMPGKVEKVGGSDEYLVFVPDYVQIDKRDKGITKRDRKLKLTPAQRAKRFAENRARIKKEQRFVESAWNQVAFSKKDFQKIVKWISENRSRYNQPPSTYKGEHPYEKDPFGMHHVFFAAANGFIQMMDPHSGILDRESWARIRRESQDSSFEGIGALLRGGGTRDVVVETPLPGSPALKAGLRAGDIIRKVDGKTIESLPLSQVVKRIRGKKATVVALFVERPTELRSLTIRIKRDVIELKAVSSRYRADEGLGILKISSFLYDTDRTSVAVRREYQALLRKAGKPLKGLIIDLRNNPGGDLDEAINTTGLFLPEDKVVVTIKRRNRTRNRRNRGEPMIPMRGGKSRFPVIVLINAGSASASEILASALMDHSAALVLGDRSFGKASVQGLQPRGDVILKLTTARYYAPKGYTIQVYGVQPDIRVSDEPDGTFPPRFREEDMWRHLPELTRRKADSAREAWLEKLKAAVGKNEAAEQYLKKHKNDALKPDYMLTRALGYLKAMKRYPRP